MLTHKFESFYFLNQLKQNHLKDYINLIHFLFYFLFHTDGIQVEKNSSDDVTRLFNEWTNHIQTVKTERHAIDVNANIFQYRDYICRNENIIEGLLYINSDIAASLDDSNTATLLWNYIAGQYYDLLRSHLNKNNSLSEEKTQDIRVMLRHRTKRRVMSFFEIINKYPSLLLSGASYCTITDNKAKLFELDVNDSNYVAYQELLPDIPFKNESQSFFVYVNSTAGKKKKSLFERFKLFL